MTKKRSYRLIILFSLILVLFVNVTVGSVTANINDIQNQITANKNEKTDLQNEIDQLRQKIDAQKKENAAITAEMAAVLAEKQQQASELQKMMDDLDYIYEQIESYQKTIEETEQNYNEALEMFYTRARVMYQYSRSDYLRLFVESQDLFDYANRDRLFARMMESDRKTLEDLKVMKADLEQKKSIQQQMQISAEALIAEKEAVIAAIKKNETDIMERLTASRSAVEALESQEEYMLQESERIAARIKELERQYAELTYSPPDGKLMWPTRNTRRISSYFGMRIHPIYGYPKMHNGIDIAASFGTDILASADGVVTSVLYNEGGYGWYIVVYHGDGISTLYAHCSKTIATVGQSVKQGQVIGLVGMTGAATGPHIHYEVRENGKPVDPLGYVNP